MADETSFCSNPDCKHATIGHFAPRGCMMPGCKCTRTYGNADGPEGSEAPPAAAASSAATPVQGNGTPALIVPADCIVSPCKIGPGRFVPVIVPLKLSKTEAQRLIAFILAQADDSDPAPVPPTESAATVAKVEAESKVEGNV